MKKKMNEEEDIGEGTRWRRGKGGEGSRIGENLKP